MMVLGADPDAPMTPWEDADDYVPQVYAAPQVRKLINYFGYHRNMKMSQRFNETDKGIVGKLLSRRLKQGYTPESLMKMIDRFFQSWAAELECPSYVFVSNKVQEHLLQEAEVVKQDPVLEWLLFGMPNTDMYQDPAAVRKAVLLASPDLTHAYPDVVANAIREDDTYEGMRAKLAKAERNVAELPAYLQRTKRATISMAIGSIPLTKKVEWHD